MADDKRRAVVTRDGGHQLRLVMILIAVIIAIATFTAIWFSNQGGAGGDDAEPGSNLETGQIDPGTETTTSP